MPKIMAQPDANTGRRRGRRVTTSLSEINVTPLVDVMLVLLIIFMVTAPMLQTGIDVELPTRQCYGDPLRAAVAAAPSMSGISWPPIRSSARPSPPWGRAT